MRDIPKVRASRELDPAKLSPSLFSLFHPVHFKCRFNDDAYAPIYLSKTTPHLEGNSRPRLAQPAAGTKGNKMKTGFQITLNPAIQTAKNAKYAKAKGVEPKRPFTDWVNHSFPLIRSVFAWFAYFAVPTAFSRFTNAKPIAHRARASR